MARASAYARAASKPPRGAAAGRAVSPRPKVGNPPTATSTSAMPSTSWTSSATTSTRTDTDASLRARAGTPRRWAIDGARLARVLLLHAWATERSEADAAGAPRSAERRRCVVPDPGGPDEPHARRRRAD